MAKKPRTKDNIESFKRMLKNQQDFYRITMKHHELFQELGRIAMMPSMSEIRKELPFPNKKVTLPECFYNYPRFMMHGRILVESLDLEDRHKITSFIDRWIAETESGEEWIGTILTFIMTGILCPPIQNFHMRRVGKRIQLTLNPDTSIDDLRQEWPLIDKSISAAWPNFQKTNLTKNFNKMIQEYTDAVVAKKNVSDDFKFQGLSEFETILAKQAKDPKKAISEYRGKRLLTQGAPRKPVLIKTKKTDRDVVKELYAPKSKKDENKKVNNLRQHLRRLKS